jgi:hypothetical protein
LPLRRRRDVTEDGELAGIGLREAGLPERRHAERVEASLSAQRDALLGQLRLRVLDRVLECAHEQWMAPVGRTQEESPSSHSDGGYEGGGEQQPGHGYYPRLPWRDRSRN